MEQSVLRDEFPPGVVRLTLNRSSALNALNADVLRLLLVELGELKEEFAQARRARQFSEDSPRVLILKGAGEMAFAAGADITVLKEASEGKPQLAHEFIRLGNTVMEALETLPIPVIAQVDGFCLGGGLELALSCDLIVASNRSKFGLPEVSLGLIPGFGGTQRLPRRVGVGAARRMIFTGEMLTSSDAEKLRLIDVSLEPESVEEKVLSIAKGIAERSPLAIESVKLALRAQQNSSSSDGHHREEELFLSLVSSEDAREGLAAFTEKRRPVFHGR